VLSEGVCGVKFASFARPPGDDDVSCHLATHEEKIHVPQACFPTLADIDALLETYPTARRCGALATLDQRSRRPWPPVTVTPTATSRRHGSGIGGGRSKAFSRALGHLGFSGSAGPRYLGFVTGGANTGVDCGRLADRSIYDQNPTAGNRQLGARTSKRETVDHLRQLFWFDVRTGRGCSSAGRTMVEYWSVLPLFGNGLASVKAFGVSDEGALAALGPVIPCYSGTDPFEHLQRALSVLGIGGRKVGAESGHFARSRGHRHRRAGGRASRPLQGEPAIVVASAGIRSIRWISMIWWRLPR